MPSSRAFGLALLLLCLAGCGGDEDGDANAATDFTIRVTGMVQELGIT